MCGLRFIGGSIFGGLMGAAIMSCMYLNRSNEYENTIRQLQEQLEEKEPKSRDE